MTARVHGLDRGGYADLEARLKERIKDLSLDLLGEPNFTRGHDDPGQHIRTGVGHIDTTPGEYGHPAPKRLLDHKYVRAGFANSATRGTLAGKATPGAGTQKNKGVLVGQVRLAREEPTEDREDGRARQYDGHRETAVGCRRRASRSLPPIQSIFFKNWLSNC